MALSRPNYNLPIDQFIYYYASKMDAYYNDAEPLTYPPSTLPYVAMRKMYDLACAKDHVRLKEYIKLSDERMLKYWVIFLAAREGNQETVKFLVQQFGADQSTVQRGYACGGHFHLLTPNSIKYHESLIGFALGRHIKKVNEIVNAPNESKNTIYSVAASYSEGGHTETLPETLELITLTASPLLKKEVARRFIEKNPATDLDWLFARSEKLAAMINARRITYAESLKILEGIESVENNHDNLQNTFFNNDPLTLFKNAIIKKLTYFQRKALQEGQQYSLTENIIANWQHDGWFSPSHYQALIYLLRDKQVEPKQAVKEISHLNGYEVSALQELYDKGLRGHHLLEWKKEQGGFTAASLEAYLSNVSSNALDPVAALLATKGGNTIPFSFR